LTCKENWVKEGKQIYEVHMGKIVYKLLGLVTKKVTTYNSKIKYYNL